jgi:hypothetical protein
MTMGGPIPDARQRVSAHRDSVPIGLRHPGDSASIYQLEQPEGDCGHCTGHAHAQRKEVCRWLQEWTRSFVFTDPVLIS